MSPASPAAYVLDASVALKWLITSEEPDRLSARALRERHVMGLCQLVVPELFWLEVLNVLRWRRDVFSEAVAEQALASVEALGLVSETLTPDLLWKTNAISWRYGTTIYDAVYVALAVSKSTPFVTADEGLIRQMRGHSLVLRLRDLELRQGS